MEGYYWKKMYLVVIYYLVIKGVWLKEMINVGSIKLDIVFKLLVNLK